MLKQTESIILGNFLINVRWRVVERVADSGWRDSVPVSQNSTDPGGQRWGFSPSMTQPIFFL